MNHVELNEKGNGVTILDQSLLPGEEKYIELKTPEELYLAIKNLQVRGAPAIGIFAGYAMAALARQEVKPQSVKSCCGASGTSDDVFMQKLQDYGAFLKSSRPTAVNLSWAVDRVIHAARVEMFRARKEHPEQININAGARRLADAVKAEAIRIHEEDIQMCRSISRYGMEELARIAQAQGLCGAESKSAGPGSKLGILTHCNAGPLATSEYGTALGPMILAQEEAAAGRGIGVELRVFADETRPLLQGARLTTYELMKAGVDVTLICDNMASIVMKNGWVHACFTGCDRVAANGDTANKIGTSGVAVLAKHYGIPFYILGPSSSIDHDCKTGADIPIEERDPEEIAEKFYEKPMAPSGVKCFNPAFDVTDHELISGIITEKGIIRPPFEGNL